MINFWRYLCGYLKIMICGKNAEKILNISARNRIHIWGMRCEKGNITGNISIKDFYKLRIAKRGIKCRIKILKKHGALFFTDKYKLRLGFISGFIIFLTLLNFLSGYIWVINVEGNENVAYNKIIHSCKKIGIHEGIRKKKINPQNDAQRLLLYQNDLAWASFNIEGSVLNINITEIIPENDTLDGKPVNIKAAFDGKIKKIDVSKGNTLIRQGDYVTKGDLLVSGVIERYGTTAFVHSEGVIIAETKRVFVEEGNYTQRIKHNLSSGKRYALKVFNKAIPLFLNNHKLNYSAEYYCEDIKLFGNKIPIKIIGENYVLNETILHTYSKENLINKLRKKIEYSVQESEFESYEQIEEKIVETEKGIKLIAQYNCQENIGISEEILLGSEN